MGVCKELTSHLFPRSVAGRVPKVHFEIFCLTLFIDIDFDAFNTIVDADRADVLRHKLLRSISNYRSHVADRDGTFFSQ